jgi:O-antigen/teichoic acid export membrane protein
MKLVNRNIIANLVGQVGTAALGILATPLFFEFFGPDRYGVILFFTTLLTLIAFIDIGLGSAFVWRISAKHADSRSREQTSRLLSWAMLYYVASSITLGGLMIVGSEWIVTEWLTIPSKIHHDAILGLKIWGVAVMFRWPITLLSGVLNGLERQTALNQITLAGTFVRIALAIGVAKWIGSHIYLYSMTFLVVSVLEFLSIIYAITRESPLRITFLFPNKRALRELALFSGGIALTSLAAWFIKTIDMFIIGGRVPIAEFSVYQTTFSLLTGFTLIAAAVMRAFYPRMSAESQQPEKVAAAFYRATGLIALTVVPAACVFVLNAELILTYWIRSEEIASRPNNILLFQITTIAMAINAIMQGPQILAWSSGNSRLTANSNLIAVIFFVPSLFFLINNFGIVGGGIAWLAYNILYYSIFPTYVFKNSIGRGIIKWYIYVIGASLFTIFIIVSLHYIIFSEQKWINFLTSVLGVLLSYIIVYFLYKHRLRHRNVI